MQLLLLLLNSFAVKIWVYIPKLSHKYSETRILAAILKFRMAAWTKWANDFINVLIEFVDP